MPLEDRPAAECLAKSMACELKDLHYEKGGRGVFRAGGNTPVKTRLLASFIAFALPLALTAVAPAFAHEDGTSHEDGNVFHDRSYGRHVDHEHGPNGEHIDHDYTGGRHVDHDNSYGGHIDHDYTNGRHVDRVYRYPDRDPYGYDGYRYDGRDRGSYRGYYGSGRYDRDDYYGRFNPYRDRGYNYGRYYRDRDYDDDGYYPEPVHSYRTHHRSWWWGW
jgi:hypothetical protein